MARQPHDQADWDPLVDALPSRYVVGIDLGTTNSAVSFVDTEESPWQVRVLSIPQLVAPGQVESLPTLPSFHYEPAAGEGPADQLRLPWHRQDPRYAVGTYAAFQAAANPARSISSAKSWLCHPGVDRTAALLPWHGAADVERISPVDASSRYLEHIHQAWNQQFPSHPLAEQDLVLTLPASFDEIARELTIAAAAEAGLRRVVLIEEPQAAFYAWVNKHRDDWHKLIEPGHRILVCDIGGGTTDFTLIQARAAATESGVQFHRIAVGDHLILGGDNMDLAVARHVEQHLASTAELSPFQWSTLVRNARHTKEAALGERPPESLTVRLPGSGSRLIGGGMQVELPASEVQELLLEGFLPQVELDEKPQRGRSGFREFGLPYAADPAMTRHLAAFLTAHGSSSEHAPSHDSSGHDAGPDVVLFNGGFFASPLLRRRTLEVLGKWFAPRRGSGWMPQVLENERLDLAVSIGAAYYGMVRRGEGVRIVANLARSYYVGFASEPPAAVCLLPGTAEPGESVTVENRPFVLAVSEPVEFPMYVSSVRLTDAPGDLVSVDPEQMRALPPIRTVLQTRGRRQQLVTVGLHAELTEIGTLNLWCHEREGERRWRLQFDVRSATQTDVSGHEGQAETAGFVEEEVWEDCRRVLEAVFGPRGQEKPAQVVKQLVGALEMERSEWPPSLLRRIWEALLEREAGRQKSAAHEARWLNLLGYALRPGYGLAVDDWRVAETWRAVYRKLKFSTPANRTEALILWRRIAGGLTLGQQQAVAEGLLPPLRVFHQHYCGTSRRHADVLLKPQETVEAWRLLGSLELLPVTTKIELGDLIGDLLRQPKLESVVAPMAWAWGRLGQRAPVYGPLNSVVPVEHAQRWLTLLLRTDGLEPAVQLAVMQIARKVDDRYRDVSVNLRREALHWLETVQAPVHYRELVEQAGQLAEEEESRVVGEALPKGLRLASV